MEVRDPGFTDELIEALGKLRFSEPVTHVYNPLVYARKGYDEYWRRYGTPPKEVVLLGMNPGPWGMAQTGVPFGEVEMVKCWLGITAEVNRPEREHPRRRVQGFDCRRSEVSGRRIWGWARKTFGTPESFFQRFFVANYCPLVFMEESGRNRPPCSLPARERRQLFEICDLALMRLVKYLTPRLVVGVGKFAEERARSVLAGMADVRVGGILHPSPANPLANRNWSGVASEQLRGLGLDL